MKILLSTLATLLFATAAVAQDQLFVEGTFYNKDKTMMGWFRQTCTDKKQAQDLIVKYTNSVTGIAAGLDVSARLHICNHDYPHTTGCIVELIAGKNMKEVVLGDRNTNHCVVVKQAVTIADKKSIRDNVPTFRVPATKGAEKAKIEKIVAEEFVGKQVVTNVSATAVEARP